MKRYSSIFLVCLGLVLFGQVPASFAQTKAEADTKAEAAENKAEPANSEATETKKKTRKRRFRSGRSVTRADSSLLSVFKPVAISASESTVRVMSGSRQIAVGTVVGSDGIVMTKASELRGQLKCRLADGEVLAAEVIGIDTQHDLALLKVDADGLAVAPLADEDSPLRGSWLVTPIDEKGKIAIGVVAVNEREIPRGGAFIGINMQDSEEGVEIVTVIPGLPAAKARLRAGDIILKLDDDVIDDIESLRESIGKYSPENRITLKVLRGDEEMEFLLTLEDRNRVGPMGGRSRIQNRMGSELSRRAKDFPMAFQHDTALQANQCGGPVVDIEGRIVGINIAREGRVSSLAIPTSLVLAVIDKLKTGEFSPVAVYADRIKYAETDLKKLTRSLAKDAKSLDKSTRDYDSQSARIQELERMRKDVAQRIEKIYQAQALELEKLKTETSERINELYKEREGFSKTRRQLKAKNKEAQVEINKLKRKIEALKKGRSY